MASTGPRRLNRIEAQFTALRYFTLDGTDHADHKEQGSMIRRYIIWRNRHADDRRLRAVVDRASGNRNAPANTLGIRHVAFAVEDIDAVVTGLRARGEGWSWTD
ncbi:hypothetical protein Q3Y56_31915 [Streptomyces sp. XD-27]|nr:hypothetical protein [Streptomyces sp. XD-27]WKX73866.1 hypothetical protein Q3Y56_31915 [Streptomyces sp. XD-27]